MARSLYPAQCLAQGSKQAHPVYLRVRIRSCNCAYSQETMVKIAKKLKKNSIAVDIVSFGCESENEEKLTAFHEAVNSNNNSNLVTVPPGPVLTDVLIGSPIFQGEGGGFGFAGGAGGSGAAAGGGGAYEFGVDPNLDPELALALRVSLEEERARQNAMAAAAAAAGGGAAAGDAAAPAPAAAAGASAPAAGAQGAGDMDLDEDALLQQALAMSMAVDQTTPAPAAAPATTPPPAPPRAGPTGGAFDDVEDEELRMALAMSMQDSGPPANKVGEVASKEHFATILYSGPRYVNLVIFSSIACVGICLCSAP